jgi:archaeosine synthase beta-subunit
VNFPDFTISNQWILSQRGVKNKVDPSVPYAYMVEKERLATGEIADVTTVFLTNKECPFRCLMCDLWQNTTDQTVSVGAIPQQIEFALERLPQTKHIKLYNSGNFFDKQAVPPEDYDALISLLGSFETVLIENHPNLTDRRVLDFRDKLKSTLQVAMGLETVHPEVLPKLNKQMTLQDFDKAVRLLKSHEIDTRAFILLRPPFLDEHEGIIWAKKSIDFAFDCGVECCVVIPTRSGNGALNLLKAQGYFHEPALSSLESVQDYGMALDSGRVFADLWDVEQFSACPVCLSQRKDRINEMNLTQTVLSSITCESCR